MTAEASYLLKVLSPEGTSVRRFLLSTGEHVAGSLAGVEIPLDGPGVSRRHARLTVLKDGGVVITDLDSKNGTFIGGEGRDPQDGDRRAGGGPGRGFDLGPGPPG